MAEQTGLLVKNVVEGGSAGNGNEVFFKLRLDNGESERDLMFICPHGIFPNLLQMLVTYGGVADEERAKQGGGGNSDGQATTRMMTATGVKAGRFVGAGEGNSKVALRFTLPTGMNLDVALDGGLARELIGQIEAQLAEM